jgi:hypothetical protein
MLNRRVLMSVVVALATTITTQSFAQDRGTGATPAAGATFTTSDAIPWFAKGYPTAGHAGVLTASFGLPGLPRPA